MSTPRVLFSRVAVCSVLVLTASIRQGSNTNTLSAQRAARAPNPSTGEGLPNPTTRVIRNWGQLPAGRTWGTSAGVEIEPKDGNIWAYERCGAGALGGAAGGGVSCDTNLVDPIFKS